MSSTASSKRSPHNVGYLLKRAHHAFRTRLDDALRPLGLTAPQYSVLAAVDAAAGVSNADLARLAYVKPQTMQAILAILERDGLLARTADPDHGRILQSTLTKKGRSVLTQAEKRVRELEALLADTIGSNNIASFADMLAKCADALAGVSARETPRNCLGDEPVTATPRRRAPGFSRGR